jgi:hypothetical protein
MLSSYTYIFSPFLHCTHSTSGLQFQPLQSLKESIPTPTLLRSVNSELVRTAHLQAHSYYCAVRTSKASGAIFRNRPLEKFFHHFNGNIRTKDSVHLSPNPVILQHQRSSPSGATGGLFKSSFRGWVEGLSLALFCFFSSLVFPSPDRADNLFFVLLLSQEPVSYLSSSLRAPSKKKKEEKNV